MNVEKDQLLCMLGPNGAGKTTTVSCLTGINPVTQGDGNSCDRNFSHIFHSLKLLMCNTKHFSTASVYDQSIRSSMGMTNIRRMMGVCPQVTLFFFFFVIFGFQVFDGTS